MHLCQKSPCRKLQCLKTPCQKFLCLEKYRRPRHHSRRKSRPRGQRRCRSRLNQTLSPDGLRRNESASSPILHLASLRRWYLRIVERDGGLVYIAQPGGNPPTEFVLTELDKKRAVFVNPRHDFPQRIIYEPPKRHPDRVDRLRQGRPPSGH